MGTDHEKNNIIQRWVISVLVSVLAAGIIGFINFVFITGRYSEKFASIQSRTAVLESNYHTMNTEGTYFSKSQLKLDERELLGIEEKLKVHDAIISKIPLLEATQTRMDGELKELHQRK